MPVPAGSRFIDVAFDRAVPWGQSCGLIYEPPDEMFAAAPARPYSSYTPLIPCSEWKARADLINPRLRKFIREVKNQRNEGSCVFNSITGQWQFAAAQQFGWDVDYVILSAIIGYSIYGASPGSGSMVSDSIKFMLETGCIPESGHGYTYPHQFGPTGYYEAQRYRRENPLWKETAKEFMALEYYRVSGVDEWATALLNGHAITKGRAGHCIFDFLWDYDQAGKWFAGYCNSWGQWGDVINEFVGRGLGWDSEASIRNQTGYALVGVKLRNEIGNKIILPTSTLAL